MLIPELVLFVFAAGFFTGCSFSVCVLVLKDYIKE